MDYFEQRIDRDDKYHGIIVDVHLDNVRLSDGSKARRSVVVGRPGEQDRPAEPRPEPPSVLPAAGPRSHSDHRP